MQEETMEASAVEALVSAYCDAWNESDPDKRARMLSAVWADDGVYIDPTVVAKGAAELSAHIGRVLERNPGTGILRISKADCHHGLLRFSFARVKTDGSVRARAWTSEKYPATESSCVLSDSLDHCQRCVTADMSPKASAPRSVSRSEARKGSSSADSPRDALNVVTAPAASSD